MKNRRLWYSTCTLDANRGVDHSTPHLYRIEGEDRFYTLDAKGVDHPRLTPERLNDICHFYLRCQKALITINIGARACAGYNY